MPELPRPVTAEELYLAAIYDELRTIRSHLTGDTPREPSSPGGAPPNLSGMPKHVGGPWFELPDGERVKGKAEAQRRMAELRG